MGLPKKDLICFNNGVLDLSTNLFRQHNKSDWLTVTNDVNYYPAKQEESFKTHAPNFHQWLSRATNNNSSKMNRVLAALYMVLANRYDWQLFLEVTGAGGSGKSIFAEICTMLAGKSNTVIGTMDSLEKARERALIVGYSLIILPDQPRYVGSGSGLKAITGGDEVTIDPKHKQPYSTKIPAVLLAVNNEAMRFTERNGGVSRRRVIFHFGEVIPESERDYQLIDKIAHELPTIIRLILNEFAEPTKAKQLLHEQQKSEEALLIKRESDHLVDFCSYLIASGKADGLLMGNANITPFSPRRYLYHAYITYTRGMGLTNPLSLTQFGLSLSSCLSEFGLKYIKNRTKQGMRTNLDIEPNSIEDWLSKADEPE